RHAGQERAYHVRLRFRLGDVGSVPSWIYDRNLIHRRYSAAMAANHDGMGTVRVREVGREIVGEVHKLWRRRAILLGNLFSRHAGQERAYHVRLRFRLGDVGSVPSWIYDRNLIHRRYSAAMAANHDGMGTVRVREVGREIVGEVHKLWRRRAILLGNLFSQL